MHSAQLAKIICCALVLQSDPMRFTQLELIDAGDRWEEEQIVGSLANMELKLQKVEIAQGMMNDKRGLNDPWLAFYVSFT